MTAFEGDEDEGQRLKTLRRRVRTGLSDDERDEKKRLEKKEERLEGEVTEWNVEVREWGAKLRELTQPGKDFATRALGT